MDIASEGKQCSDRKHQVSPGKESLKGKATTWGEYFIMDGNGEYSGNQLIPVNVSDEELESELDIWKLSLEGIVSSKGCSSKITPKWFVTNLLAFYLFPRYLSSLIYNFF